MRIVFFGTPEFAVPSLEALLAEGAQVVGVVTQPDKARGRSRSELVPPPVKQAADRHRLPVLQPERPVGDVFLAALRHWHPELGIVVAYGHLLRPEVLRLPPRGMLNLHASLLPHLRGAAPINWAILQGDAESGVSIMQMEAGLDSGPVLRRTPTRIGMNETAGELRQRLATLGAETLIETLALMRLGRLTPEPQDPALASYAPKIDRKVTRIDWNETAAAIARRIRAFDPVPGAWATLEGHEVKLFGAIVHEADGRPGEVLASEGALRIAAGQGAVEVAEVQPAGRARMAAAAWSRGRGARPGQLLA
ncbi:MAG TPA: methionyl-tRNA formyltransferase [Gemmatimonadales bacterium]|nr:methionyl-tRNA formyltransferase [Gemmatimonadales bacterium]